jgi:hypothetical protein
MKAAEELAKEEEQINRHNKKFKEGKSTFYEALNKYSDIPIDMFAKEFMGLQHNPEHGRY